MSLDFQPERPPLDFQPDPAPQAKGADSSKASSALDFQPEASGRPINRLPLDLLHESLPMMARPIAGAIETYQQYRNLPGVKPYNEFMGRLGQSVRQNFLPETPIIDPQTHQPILDPKTGQVRSINVPLETAKGTLRELAASAVNFDTDVIVGMILAGPTFKALGNIPLPGGQTLGKLLKTPMGKGWAAKKTLPPQVNQQAASFRPESVWIPQEPVTVQEAAEAARQGAAHILSERPLGPDEILELYKFHHGLVPDPVPPIGSGMKPGLPAPNQVVPPAVIQQGTSYVPPKQLPAPLPAAPSLTSPAARQGAQERYAEMLSAVRPPAAPVQAVEREPATEFGRMLRQQMQEIETIPLHPAKAGRAGLKKIFGDAAGFVALPEDDDALRAMQEAAKLGGVQATSKFAENINLSKINDASVRAAMQDYIERNPGSAMTPKITNQELLARAKQLADTPTIRHIATLPEGALEAEVLRNREEALGQVQKLLDGTLGPAFKTEMDAALTQYRKPASIFARALQSQNIPVEGRAALVQAVEKKLAQLAKDPVLGQDRETLKALTQFRNQILTSSELTPEMVDKLYFFWLNSILSNPLTHAVNRFSNFVFRWSKVPERFFQAMADVPAAAVTGKRSTYFGEVPAMLRGLRSKSTVPIPLGNKTDFNRIFNPFGEGKLAKVIGLPTELLRQEDDIAKNLVGKMELYAQVYREAAMTGAKGSVGKEVQARILANPSDALMTRVAKEQLYRTFQDAPSRIGQWLLSGRAKLPVLRYVIPFVRTPDRIAHAAFIERTPAQLINMARKVITWKKLGQDYTQEEFAKDLGLLMMSGGVAGWAGLQYAKGVITGDAPTSPGERAAFYAQGKKPNAFKLGNRWIPFNRVEPWGTAISATINFIQDMERSGKEAPSDKIIHAIGGIAQTLTNKSYLSGMTNFIQVLSDPERYGETWAERGVSGFVPGVVGLAAQLQNPTYLKPDGVRESVMAKIPFLSERVPPRLGRFGEVQRREPLNIGVEKISRVDGELNRLGHVIGFPATTIGERKLTNKEYNELLEMAGPTSYLTLDRMVQHPAYSVLSDEEKRKEIDAVVREDREAAREKMRVRLVMRALQGTKDRRAALQMLRKQKVLSNELYFELKQRGLN